MADAAVSFLLSNLGELVKKRIADFSISNIAESYSIGVDFVDELKLVDQVQRVPFLFRNSEAHKKAYDPVIVSIGPYHHGNKQYVHAEAFKQYSLDKFVSESNHNVEFFHNKILERIAVIRCCFEEVNEYDDEQLSTLILRDACFFIFQLQSLTKQTDSWKDKFAYSYTYFGAARLKFIVRDLLLLENQIPFEVIELLLCEQSDQGKTVWKKMLSKFINEVIFGHVEDYEPFHLYSTPLMEHHETFHLLGAYYQALKVQTPVRKHEQPTSGISISQRNAQTYRFRSVTNLNAKGISLKPSKSDISFVSHYFSGSLNLPPLVFPTNFFVIYSNLIAYEISPTGQTDFFVSSLVNFMKSLIESPNDVKILREKGILFCDMVSDDEVVKVIKDLDTFGLENAGTFLQLRMDIERHCCSKTKTWVAELKHANFENPWKFTALVAATLLLILTALQTTATIHPFKI